MFGIVLILQFLIRLRFPAHRSVSDVISRRYGRNTWIQVRQWEGELRKMEKAKLDTTFLERCQLYNVIPEVCKV